VIPAVSCSSLIKKICDTRCFGRFHVVQMSCFQTKVFVFGIVYKLNFGNGTTLIYDISIKNKTYYAYLSDLQNFDRHKQIIFKLFLCFNRCQNLLVIKIVESIFKSIRFHLERRRETCMKMKLQYLKEKQKQKVQIHARFDLSRITSQDTGLRIDILHLN
jgi:hypothetical protein